MIPKTSAAERLRQNEELLSAQRREFEHKDRQVQAAHASLLQDSIAREQLVRELAEARESHKRNLELQREQLLQAHRLEHDRLTELLQQDAQRKLRDHTSYLEDRVEAVVDVGVGSHCSVLQEAQVFAGEDIQSEVVGVLPAGAPVVVLEAGTKAGRLKVVNHQGVEGWVSKFSRAGQPVLMQSPDLDEAEAEGGSGTAEPAARQGQRSLASPARLRLARQFAESEEATQRVLGEAELRTMQASEDLRAVQAQTNQLAAEVRSEQEAAKHAKDQVQAARRKAQRRGEQLKAELRAQKSETEALADEQKRAEAKVRDLQQQLNKTAYHVGQRDQELKVKDSELKEVRQNVASIQDEMDEVNGQLQEQCSRVQHVEGSMRASRDLGEKVRAMRDMVQESHAALGQLCVKLEAERAHREQCTHGLRQQRVRTELLLQLLHHFKSRTQGLAPSSLLSGLQGGTPGSMHFNGGTPGSTTFT